VSTINKRIKETIHKAEDIAVLLQSIGKTHLLLDRVELQGMLECYMDVGRKGLVYANEVYRTRWPVEQRTTNGMMKDRLGYKCALRWAADAPVEHVVVPTIAQEYQRKEGVRLAKLDIQQYTLPGVVGMLTREGSTRSKSDGWFSKGYLAAVEHAISKQACAITDCEHCTTE